MISSRQEAHLLFHLFRDRTGGNAYHWRLRIRVDSLAGFFYKDSNFVMNSRLVPATSFEGVVISFQNNTWPLLPYSLWMLFEAVYGVSFCDLNRQAKEVVKAVKKRLQHKNGKVQFLALTVCANFFVNLYFLMMFRFALLHVEM